MNAAQDTIEVRSLTKRFGHVDAVSDLSFDVAPGRVTGFLGPNGAGKTTTLRILLDLVNATSGSATIGGRRYRDLGQPSRHVGAVLEATNFHPARKARAHLKMLAIAAGIPGTRIDEVLGLVGLTADAQRRVGGYSLGMRQRLQLASALLGDPGVLILDEPSNGLDPQGIAWLRDLLRHLASQGRTVLVSSHLLAEMAQTVDDVVIVSRGRLRAQGPLAQITSGARSVMRVRTPEAARLAAVVQHFGFVPRPTAPDVVLVDGATPEQLGPILAANQLVVYELSQESHGLEQVFLELTTAAGPGEPPVPGGLPLAPPGGQSLPPPPPGMPMPPGSPPPGPPMPPPPGMPMPPGYQPPQQAAP